MTLAVILVVLATWRATRLVVLDDWPFGPVRDRVEKAAVKSKTAAWFDSLITCQWCSSLWLGAGITALTWWLRDDGLVVPPLVAATASAVSGLLLTVEPD